MQPCGFINTCLNTWVRVLSISAPRPLDYGYCLHWSPRVLHLPPGAGGLFVGRARGGSRRAAEAA
eukprot:8133825-Pyramimonas_sp.AAC.1